MADLGTNGEQIMRSMKQGNAGKNLIALVVCLLFLLYLGLTLFKTSVSFGDNEVAFSSQSTILACGPDCIKVARGFMHYGMFDHLRTASASL